MLRNEFKIKIEEATLDHIINKWTEEEIFSNSSTDLLKRNIVKELQETTDFFKYFNDKEFELKEVYDYIENIVMREMESKYQYHLITESLYYYSDNLETLKTYYKMYENLNIIKQNIMTEKEIEEFKITKLKITETEQRRLKFKVAAIVMKEINRKITDEEKAIIKELVADYVEIKNGETYPQEKKLNDLAIEIAKDALYDIK